MLDPHLRKLLLFLGTPVSIEDEVSEKEDIKKRLKTYPIDIETFERIILHKLDHRVDELASRIV